MNKVLVIAVHPDDETLGVGGTLLKHKKDGDEIHWLICTSLSKEHEKYNSREKEIEKVYNEFRFNSLNNLRLLTAKVDKYPIQDLIQSISSVFNEIKPNIVYLPFKGDVHSDHRKIFDAAYSCTKSFRYPFIEKIYMMETLSETEFAPSNNDDIFIPNVFIDISDFLDSKIQIMKIYKSEISNHPFPRSEKNIKALATFRGATAGCSYAESFVLIKEIVK
jgi:LmbE family N-acetylglucosaminyl deacetylase|tara:strand:- start:147 stop:806 length:660 start_codon:yes stop_codon:yes gene_type:complete